MDQIERTSCVEDDDILVFETAELVSKSVEDPQGVYCIENKSISIVSMHE